MSLLNHLSLRGRFLVAPFIGVILILVLSFTSYAIIRSHSDLFQQLSDSNLPQVSQLTHVTVLLLNNHNKLSDLLYSPTRIPDEEQVYNQGRLILDELHRLDNQLSSNISSSQTIIINQVNVLAQIKQAFSHYREAVIGAIELSTVDANLAYKELGNANKSLYHLNNLLSTLSEYHVQNLTTQSDFVNDSLYDNNIMTIVTVTLVIFMIYSALYFSKHMSSGLEKINHALINLSEGRTDISLPIQNDEYLQQLISAVDKFKQTMETNVEQQASLNDTIDALTDSKERYSSLLHLVATAIIVIDDKQRIVMFNKAAELTFGYTSQEIIGQSLNLLIPEPHRHQHKIDIENFNHSDIDIVPVMKRNPVIALRKNGEQFFIEASIGKMKLINETLMTAAITDITERINAEEKILHQAHFDALTNLPNRFLSLDRLTQLINETRRKNTLVAVIFLDLDDFKKVNDSLGHETGDKLLIDASERLRNSLRIGDTVGRLGGDEFIILLDGLAEESEVIPMVENIINQFRNAFEIDDHELILTASIGISIFPEDGNSASELLRHADAAMYHAKELGRNTYSYFTKTMNQAVSRRLSLEEQMHGALERTEFKLLYQPQVDIASGHITGVEALLRWTNPVLNDVFPDEFIPIAEQTGMILPLGQFVLTEALKMTRYWQELGHENFQIAINLSPTQFREPNLVNFIKESIHQSGVPAESLKLEITEGVLMTGHGFITDALNELNHLGVGLAMDDFGTGYSSLSYLRNYPFDTLKIDRSFVRDISTSSAVCELVNATISMAHGLGLKVVAEGVETNEQLTYLSSLNCEYAQGYLFSKPVSSDEISKMLQLQTYS